jgi:hypothetical protein
MILRSAKVATMRTRLIAAKVISLFSSKKVKEGVGVTACSVNFDTFLLMYSRALISMH